MKKAHNLQILFTIIALFFFTNVPESYSVSIDRLNRQLRVPQAFVDERFRKELLERLGDSGSTFDRFAVCMVTFVVYKMEKEGLAIQEIGNTFYPAFRDLLEQNLLITKKDGTIYIAYKNYYTAIKEDRVEDAAIAAFEKTSEIARIIPTRIKDDYFPISSLREKNQGLFKDGEDQAVIQYGPLGGKEILVLDDVFNPQLSRAACFFSEVLINRQLVKPGDRVLDIGGGTGVQAIAALELGAQSALSVDINPSAVENIKRNSDFLNLGTRLQARKSDLFDAIEDTETFDLILFNPPLVEGSPKGLWDRSVYDEGYEVITGFFNKVSAYLNPNGKILLIFSSKAEEQGYKNLIQNLSDINGLVARNIDNIIRHHGEVYSAYEISLKKASISTSSLINRLKRTEAIDTRL